MAPNDAIAMGAISSATVICGFPAKNFTYIKTDKQWMAETNINVLLRNPSLIAQVILK